MAEHDGISCQGWRWPCSSLCGGEANAQMAHEHHDAPKASCDSAEQSCASTASAAFAPDGTLWLDMGGRRARIVARCGDLAKSFGPAVTLPKEKLPLDDGPDARPKIAAGRDGSSSSPSPRATRNTTGTRSSRSEDGGKTFSAPMPITTNSPSQRFETAAIERRPGLRGLDRQARAAAAKAANKPYAGAALAYAWEEDAGGRCPTQASRKTTPANAAALPCPSQVQANRSSSSATFRRRHPRPRGDHLLRSLHSGSTPSHLRRRRRARCVSASRAEPRHRTGGTYHVTWFALGSKRKGLYYARSKMARATFSAPMPLGDAARQNSRPYVLAGPDAVSSPTKRSTANTRPSKYELARLRRILERASSWPPPRRTDSRLSSALVGWKAALFVVAYAQGGVPADPARGKAMIRFFGPLRACRDARGDSDGRPLPARTRPKSSVKGAGRT